MVADRFPLPQMHTTPSGQGSYCHDAHFYRTRIRGDPEAIEHLVETRPELAIRVVSTFGDKDVARAFIEKYRLDNSYWSTASDMSKELRNDTLVYNGFKAA